MPDNLRKSTLIQLGCWLALLVWGFWPTISFLVGKWIEDPQYSHGFLVPGFAAYLLWRKGSDQLLGGKPSFGIAAGLLVLALAIRWTAGKLLFHQLDVLALLVSLFAVAFAVGGRKLARGAATAIAFLIFMVPLPYEMEQNVGGPLKMVATNASTFLLQTLGYPAVAEGNVIHIDEVTLGVVDACSGLKMLMTFAAFAVGAVLMADRTYFEKGMILVGVVPIAVVVNVLRVTATGVAYTFISDKGTQNFVHDFHGWLMMPAGLGLLWLQLWVLDRLVIRPTSNPEPIGLRPALGMA